MLKLTRPRDLASLQQRLLATPLRVLLIPLSWLYGAAVQLRDSLYTYRILKPRQLPSCVISVGNIAVGGTGKTPAVIAIAKHLKKEGKQVAILLRGYKREVHEKVTIVSDGKKICVAPAESGDEPYMLATHLSNVPILVGKSRYLAGQVALERFAADTLILDDGFQHRQLARDVDILTIPITHPFGNPPSRLLPLGTLREKPTALRRADLILLTHTDATDTSQHAKKIVETLAPNVPILESIHQPTHLYPLGSNRESQKRTEIPTDIKDLKGKRVLAVCGIGNPDAFVATLTRCAVASVTLLTFPDHHSYTEQDKQQIETAFQTAGAELIVITQKDEQKLAQFLESWDLPIAVLAVTLVITKGSEKLTTALRVPSSVVENRGK